MPSMDLAAYAGVIVVAIFGACVAALVAMRDTTHAAPHTVSRWVRCPRHERVAMVDFTERMQTGLAMRTVLHCPLRRPGESCGEGCRWEEMRSP